MGNPGQGISPSEASSSYRGHQFHIPSSVSSGFCCHLKTLALNNAIMADSQEKGNTLRTDAEHIDHTTSVAGHAADQEDHDETFTQAFSRHKKACFWCFYACWTIILVAFDTQAAGAVIGIPQFRKDFGYQYGNDWVIPASWQSAFSGAPTAS